MTDKLNTEYRTEIDGLRALAVLPVISFHAGFDIFSGGFVGVDIFFVISGYLITTIIIKELDNNTFSFKKFYERRARRIFPALIFVILISSIISFIFLTRSELASYFKSVIATLLFFSNLYFYKTTPYFRSESDLEPLLHTWSLSIEEQFYIIFPITLLLFHKFFKRYIFLMFIFGFAASLFICQFLALKTGGTLNFYFTLSRAWELALGAICAYIIIYKNLSFSILIKNQFSIVGIFLIVFSIFFFNRQTVFPSFFTLVPTIGTSLIILFADRDTFVNKILSIKLLVSIGLISYSLYLWHQPLLAFGRIFFDDLPSP
jgi:peptidoglycan/LPS O-acetylase OafA/YrhL